MGKSAAVIDDKEVAESRWGQRVRNGMKVKALGEHTSLEGVFKGEFARAIVRGHRKKCRRVKKPYIIKQRICLVVNKSFRCRRLEGGIFCRIADLPWNC